MLGLLGPIAAAHGAVVALALCLAPKGPTPIARQRRWAGPAAALVATVLLAGLALTVARIRPAVPRTDALFYELDAQTGNARWLASGPPDEWTRLAVGDSARQTDVGDLLSVSPLRGFFPGQWSTAPAVAVSLPAPSVTVLTDATGDDGIRHLSLRVASARRARAIMLVLRGAQVLDAELGGQRLPRETLRRPQSDPWGLRFVLPPEDGVVVSLRIASRASPTLDISDESIGLPSVAEVLPQRPDTVLPIHMGDLTFVRTRMTLSAVSPAGSSHQR